MDFSHPTRRPLAGLAAMVLSLATAPATFAQAVPARDLAAVARAAQDSLAGMKTRGASWTARVDVGAPQTYLVDMIALDTSRRITMHVAADGRDFLLATLVIRDGVWYCDVNGKKSKCRPYEADLGGALGYSLLQGAEPHFYDANLQLPSLQRQAGGTLISRTPLDAQTRAQVQANLTQLEAQAARGGAGNAGQASVIAFWKDLLANGLQKVIDPSTGCLVRNDPSPNNHIQLTGFHLLDHPPVDALNVDAKAYADETAPLTADRENLALFRFLSDWRPGLPLGDMELVMVDLSTGKWRRVPEPSESASACFSLDHKTAWLSASSHSGSGLVLRQVDLMTGASKEFGKKIAFTGNTLEPHLSRDGKYLAAIHANPGESLLASSILIVDATSQIEKTAGDPGYHGPVDWANENLLVFELRDPPKPGDRALPPGMITVMDLDGKAKPLLRGKSPVVVADGQRILFLDGADWKTCDLTGQQATLVGNGLHGLSQPAPSRDGKRVLMIDTSSPQGPQPVIVTLDTGKIDKVKMEAGYWTSPSWR